MTANERTGWRDESLSSRHRDWGFNCPAVDIDFLMVEYDQQKPVALIDYKCKETPNTMTRDANYKAMSELADRAEIPAFYVYYGSELDWFAPKGINERGQKIEAKMRKPILTEKDFVSLLYWLRNRKLPDNITVRSVTTDKPCLHNSHVEDCYLCSGAAKTLREADVFPTANWREQYKTILEEVTNA